MWREKTGKYTVKGLSEPRFGFKPKYYGYFSSVTATACSLLLRLRLWLVIFCYGYYVSVISVLLFLFCSVCTSCLSCLSRFFVSLFRLSLNSFFLFLLFLKFLLFRLVFSLYCSSLFFSLNPKREIS